ncbi:nicotinate-nucleotide-dimethylbenzimidazole phosphoribosyltransferase [Zhouia amylolytica]|uniref:Nicotinate-nucleotide--dimethylbenzimidazole phosphoribosyltransferase n=1 Tax=Zhouia amylolytica TaxID=376730 RepID=A0A1I6QJG8_9FLAO|nr:nicotinate-nucleotide--dimethylbenzimidazole phosphoribosyltransferase [Zhouia amylolytica]SFS52633.1 nicotinate-nucleotide-dimethylbenzimidazole phosphoribosyltransferase [Zhouia amylolytica]
MKFTISPLLNNNLKEKLQYKIDNKTKPIGALGVLEKVALQIGAIQETLEPKIKNPTILVFAGDHGIAQEGIVNPYPQEVTTQMVYNFLQGGAAINVFSETNNIDLQIIDAGVNYNFEKNLPLIHAKIDFGTKNYRLEPAMNNEQCLKAIKKGAELVEDRSKNEVNTIGFGEMGIGNTSSAALLMHYITKTPIENCVGAGTGLNAEGIQNKTKVLSEVLKKHHPNNPLEALATFGGYEIAMIVGAILKAAEHKMTIIIDGFIVTSALLIAIEINKNVIDYCIFAHSSNEQGHQKMLEYLNVKPLLNFNMRLGEGTGAAMAVPVLRASTDFLNHMASFESAGVSTKSE